MDVKMNPLAKVMKQKLRIYAKIVRKQCMKKLKTGN